MGVNREQKIARFRKTSPKFSAHIMYGRADASQKKKRFPKPEI